jgi:hypothetical protein
MRLSAPCEFVAGPQAICQKVRDAQTDCNEDRLRCPQTHAQLTHQLLGRRGERGRRAARFALPRFAPRIDAILAVHHPSLAPLFESSSASARPASPITRFCIRLVAFHDSREQCEQCRLLLLTQGSEDAGMRVGQGRAKAQPQF